jgi:ferredoxin
MRAVVNLTRCQGYAQCAFLAPDVFRMRGAEALTYDPQPDDAHRPMTEHPYHATPITDQGRMAPFVAAAAPSARG